MGEAKRKKAGRWEAAVIEVFGRDATELTLYAERVDALHNAVNAPVWPEIDIADDQLDLDRRTALRAVSLYAFRAQYEALRDGLFLAARVLGKLDELKAALKG